MKKSVFLNDSMKFRATLAIIIASAATGGVALHARAGGDVTLLMPQGGGFISGHSVPASWTIQNDAIASSSWALLWSKDGFVTSGSQIASGAFLYENGTTFDSTGIPDGAYKFRITGGANGGVFDTNAADVVVDNTKPTVTLAMSRVPDNANGYYKGPNAPTFTLSCEDITAGCASMQYRIDGGAWTSYSSPSAVTVADGTHVISYTATDKAGNISDTGTENVMVDTVAHGPTISLDHNLLKLGATTKITVTYDEDTPSDMMPTITAAGAALTGVTRVDARTYTGTYTVTGLVDGAYDVSVSGGTDMAGNTFPSSGSKGAFTVDATAPTVTAALAAGYGPITNDNHPKLAIHSSEAGKATFGGACVDGEKTVSTGDNSVTLATQHDGTYSDCAVTVTDAAGNVSSAATVLPAFTIDTVAPTITTLSVSKSPTNVAATLTGIASDNDGGSGLIVPSAIDATNPWSTVAEHVAIVPNFVNHTASVWADLDGTYPITYTATDKAGNHSEKTIQFTWDTKAPAAPTLAGNSKLNLSNLTNYMFHLTGEAKSAFSIFMKGDVSDTKITGGVMADGAMTDVAVDMSNVLVADGSTGTFYAKLVDDAGNTSLMSSLIPITRDTTSPTVTNVNVMDVNGDGKLDTAMVTFSEPVKTNPTDSWAVAGRTATEVACSPMLPVFVPSATQGVSDVMITPGIACDLATLKLSFDPVEGTGPTTVTYTGTTITDNSDNTLMGVDAEVVHDKASPVLLSAVTLENADGVRGVEATYSESVASVDGSKLMLTDGDAAITHGVATVKANKVFIPSNFRSDAKPTVTDLSGGAVDSSANMSLVKSVIATDGVAASVDLATAIALGDDGKEFVKVGDKIHVTANFDEKVKSAIAQVGAMTSPASMTLAEGGMSAAYEYTITSSDLGGLVTVQVGSTDMNNNVRSPRDVATGMASGKRAMIDKTSPIISDMTGGTVNTKIFDVPFGVTDGESGSGVATNVWTGAENVEFAIKENGVKETVTVPADGDYTITLTSSDNAGNSSHKDVTFHVDSTAPTAPTVTVGDVVNMTNVSAFSVTVSGEAGATYALKKGLNAVNVKLAKLDASGHATFPIDLSGEAQGALDLIVTLTDDAGNISAATTKTVTVDTVAPTISGALMTPSFAKEGALVTFSYALSEQMKTNTVSIGGHSATPVCADGACVATYTVQSSDSDGALIAAVDLVDMADNKTSITNAAHITVDKTAPVIGAIAPHIVNAHSWFEAWPITDANLTSAITVVQKSGDTTGVTIGVPMATGVQLGAGHDGDYTFTVTAMDKAGNTTSKDFTVTLDTQAPSLISTAPFNGETGVSVNAQNIILNFSEAIKSVDASKISFVTQHTDVAQTLGTPTLSSDGKTVTAAISGPLLADVSYRVNVATGFATDMAGNASQNMAPVYFTTKANVNAPAVPVITTASATTNDLATVLSGTEADNGSVRVISIMRNGTVFGSLTLTSGQTAWTLPVSLVASTVNAFTAKAISGGVESGLSNVVNLTQAQGNGLLVIRGIDTMKSDASADGTYANGWKWRFHVTAPANEPKVAMKFSDFLSGTSKIGAENIRYCSLQSSDRDCSTDAKWIPIISANTYGSTLMVDTSKELDASMAGLQFDMDVNVKVPVGALMGSYNASYGIMSGVNSKSTQ